MCGVRILELSGGLKAKERHLLSEVVEFYPFIHDLNVLILLITALLLYALGLHSTRLNITKPNIRIMNPHSPKQQYPLYIVKEALNRCLQERENAEFLMETKQQLIEIVQQEYSMMHDLDQEIVLPNLSLIHI